MNKNSLERIWRIAAQDLDIEATAPSILQLEDGSYFYFVALVVGFGSAQGTLVTTSEHEDGSPEAAEKNGYYWSALYPEAYTSYERREFIDMLNDWGWFGDDDKKPLWYTGNSWS